MVAKKESFGALLPGIAFCVLGAAVAIVLDKLLHSMLGFSAAILIAILFGIILGNLLKLPAAVSTGATFCSKQLLRFGVSLLGLSIPVATVWALGWRTLLTVLLVVTGGFLATFLLGRAFGLTRENSLLIGAGCSICGAAAISAVEGVLSRRKASEFATSIAVIVVLGTLMIFLGPALASGLGLSDIQSGVFLGGSIHEVGQVVAAGGIAGAAVLPIAVTVKLGRVLLLAPVIAGLSWIERRKVQSEGTDAADTKLPPLVPTFVLGFLALVLVRTFLPVPTSVLSVVDTARSWIFTTAMFALGLGVTISALRNAGFRPFLFGGAVSLIIGMIAFGGALLAG